MVREGYRRRRPPGPRIWEPEAIGLDLPRKRPPHPFNYSRLGERARRITRLLMYLRALLRSNGVCLVRRFGADRQLGRLSYTRDVSSESLRRAHCTMRTSQPPYRGFVCARLIGALCGSLCGTLVRTMCGDFGQCAGHCATLMGVWLWPITSRSLMIFMLLSCRPTRSSSRSNRFVCPSLNITRISRLSSRSSWT